MSELPGCRIRQGHEDERAGEVRDVEGEWSNHQALQDDTEHRRTEVLEEKNDLQHGELYSIVRGTDMEPDTML